MQEKTPFRQDSQIISIFYPIHSICTFFFQLTHVLKSYMYKINGRYRICIWKIEGCLWAKARRLQRHRQNSSSACIWKSLFVICLLSMQQHYEFDQAWIFSFSIRLAWSTTLLPCPKIKFNLFPCLSIQPATMAGKNVGIRTHNIYFGFEWSNHIQQWEEGYPWTKWIENLKDWKI